MPTFSKETYSERRRLLKERFKQGVLLFLGNEDSPMNYKDNCYHFRQDSSFLYFFGLDQPGLSGVIDVESGEEIIFGNELSIQDVVWTGPQKTLVEAAAEVGVSDTRPVKDLDATLNKAVGSQREIHFLPPYRSLNLIKIAQWLNVPVGKVVEEASKELIKGVVALRSVKSTSEVKEMAEAVNISRKLHLKAREMSHSGVVEQRIQAVLQEIVIGEGGQFAYPPIITINGQTLHNHYYGNTLKSGDLLLVDAGAENSNHYAGDITRTFPVDGKFTQQQNAIYSIVLEAEKEAILTCKPGIAYQQVHHEAMMSLAGGLKALGLIRGDLEELVTAGAHALFCPHGLGHMIGLDVHDMEDLGEDLVGYDETVRRSELFGTKALRLGRELKTGFTFTVEPGIYFIPELIDLWKAEKKFEQFLNYTEIEKYRNFGGVRIEDNVLITESGSEIIGKPIPKEVSEIEF